MLFTYAVLDRYLRDKGRLGFVITQSVFKSEGAGDGFRRLRYERDGETWRLKPLVVHDMGTMQVFEGATNRTAVFVCEKTRKPFRYPVKYRLWQGKSRVPQDEALETVVATTQQRRIAARPIRTSKRSSPWLTVSRSVLPGISKVVGQSAYTAYEGVNTGGLNGCFWVRVLQKRPNGQILVENLHDVGKIKLPAVQAVIEPDLVYPLVRGRDVGRWRAWPSAHMILAQDPSTRRGIPEEEMKRQWPKTFAYLKRFEGDPSEPVRGTLRGRALYRRYYKPSDPFYSMYNVGWQTIDQTKVFWRQFVPRLSMSVCLPVKSKELGRKVPITQHVVTICRFDSTEEALFFCACGNSSPATLLHAMSSTGKSFGQPLVLKSIAIPRFRPKDRRHARLAELAGRCYALAGSEREAGVLAAFEREIDEEAGSLWGITRNQLEAIQGALASL